MVRAADESFRNASYGSFMPIFEFVCENCNKSFEKLVLGSAAEPECPSCKSTKLAQKFSVFSASVPKASGAAPRPMGGCCGGGACGMPGPSSGCCDN